MMGRGVLETYAGKHQVGKSGAVTSGIQTGHWEGSQPEHREMRKVTETTSGKKLKITIRKVR